MAPTKRQRHLLLITRGTDKFLVGPIVLLCHKAVRRMVCWQHGQRGRVREIARAIAMRTDVIELATRRSGRIGGSAGSIISGYGRFFDENGVGLF
jgi:hypothetical protein